MLGAGMLDADNPELHQVASVQQRLVRKLQRGLWGRARSGSLQEWSDASRGEAPYHT